MAGDLERPSDDPGKVEAEKRNLTLFLERLIQRLNNKACGFSQPLCKDNSGRERGGATYHFPTEG